MGIAGLWPFLHPHHRSKTLKQLSFEHFLANESGYRGFRVAIDASMIMASATLHVNPSVLGIRKSPLTTEQKSLILSHLHSFLLALLSTPYLLPLFIFDSPLRAPKSTRGRNVPYYSFTPEKGFKRILDCWNVPWKEAERGEEGEMMAARLQKEGKVDAIWTGDGDVFTILPSLILRLPSSFSPFLSTVPSLPDLPLQTYSSSLIPVSRSEFCWLAMIIGGDWVAGLIDWDRIPLSGEEKKECANEKEEEGESRPKKKRRRWKLPTQTTQQILELGRQPFSQGQKSSFADALLRLVDNPPSLDCSTFVFQLSALLVRPEYQNLPLIPIPSAFPDLPILRSYAHPYIPTTTSASEDIKWTQPLSPISSLPEILDRPLDESEMERTRTALATQFLRREILRKEHEREGGWGVLVEEEKHWMRLGRVGKRVNGKWEVEVIWDRGDTVALRVGDKVAELLRGGKKVVEVIVIDD